MGVPGGGNSVSKGTEADKVHDKGLEVIGQATRGSREVCPGAMGETHSEASTSELCLRENGARPMCEERGKCSRKFKNPLPVQGSSMWPVG